MIPIAEDSISLTDQQHLEHKLGHIAEKIRDQGQKRRLLAKILRKVKNDVQIPADQNTSEPIESELVHSIEEIPLEDLVVCGVDGGVLSKPLHGLDLILVRAVATIFSYEGGSLQDADYHPGEMPIPELINVHEPLDSRELDNLVGLKRQLTELKRAREVVENQDIDALVLDGSVVPQYVQNASHAKTRNFYRDLIDSFTELYRTCTEKDILLLGAVEDSRSAKMAKIFREEIFPRVLENGHLNSDELSSFDENKTVLMSSRDTAFLDYFLEEGERTFAFNYAEAPANLLNDLGDWKSKIYAFYVKSVPYDRPTRVEVVGPQDENLDKIEEAASLVNTLSAAHDACALPSVLIEADARAALAEEEISILRDSIADRLEPSTMLDLRRERRPF